jgi:hypothetical protein
MAKATKKQSRDPVGLKTAIPPFWNRWTFRILVGGAVTILGGALALAELPTLCPPGTAICYHGGGTVNIDHSFFRNMTRVLGMEGGSATMNNSEVVNPPPQSLTPPKPSAGEPSSNIGQ